MKKKGFTLIELLAVILILGIIALIAIPTVTKIIEESKRGAFKTTVQNLMDAVEKKCTTDMLKDVDMEKEYIISNGVITPNVDIKGDLPNTGTILLDDECMVKYFDLQDNVFAAANEGENIRVVKIEDGKKYNPGDPIYYNPVDNIKCTKEEALANVNSVGAATLVKTGCMKWYVIETQDNLAKSTIDVILDHNTKHVASQTDTKLLKELVTNSNWVESTNPRLISADEIASIVGADREDTLKWKSTKELGTADINTQIAWFYLDGAKSINKASYSTKDGWKKQYADDTTKSSYYWLYDNLYQCRQYGCETEDNNTYLHNPTNRSGSSGYWTSSLIKEDVNAWYIAATGNLLNTNKAWMLSAGIRPVITISKEIVKD